MDTINPTWVYLSILIIYGNTYIVDYHSQKYQILAVKHLNFKTDMTVYIQSYIIFVGCGGRGILNDDMIDYHWITTPGIKMPSVQAITDAFSFCAAQGPTYMLF